MYRRNLRSPLDVVLQQFHPEENTPVDIIRWVEELQERIAMLQEDAGIKDARS